MNDTSWHCAILNEKATVKMLWSSPSLCSLTPKTHEGLTTSHVALMCGSSAAAKLVLDTVHAAGSITRSELTLLHAAALRGQAADVLQQLINIYNAAAAQQQRMIVACSCMYYAALGGCIETMKYIFANGGSMDDKSYHGATVMAAALGGSIEAMKFVLANGGSVSDKGSDGWNVLMAAAEGGSVDAVRFTLTNGSSTRNDKDVVSRTAMMAAALLSSSSQTVAARLTRTMMAAPS